MIELTRDVVIVGAGAAGAHRRQRAEEGRPLGRRARGPRPRRRSPVDRRHRRRDARDRRPVGLARPGRAHRDPRRAGPRDLQRYREGDSVYIDADGELTRFTGEIFPVPPATEKEIVALIDKLDALVAADRSRPAVGAPRRRGARPGLVRGVARASRPTTRRRATTSRCSSPARCSPSPRTRSRALQALLMAACAGSFSHLVDADFILDKRVVGGLQQVPLLLAERLGDDVVLGQAVRTLDGPTDGGFRRRSRRDRRRPRGARALVGRRARADPLLPDRVRAARCRGCSSRCTSTSRWASSSRCTPSTTAVLARAGPVRHRLQPVRARRTRPTTTPTTATSAARSSASSPTATPTTCSASRPTSARSASSSRSRTTTASRRRTRSSTTRATGAPRSGRAARTPRASTSAASPGTARTCAPPSARSTSPAATWPATATSTSTVRSAWDAWSPAQHPRGGPRMSGRHRRRLHRDRRRRGRGRPRCAAGRRHPGRRFDLVVVLPADDRSVITPPDAGYDRYLEGAGRRLARRGRDRWHPGMP